MAAPRGRSGGRRRSRLVIVAVLVVSACISMQLMFACYVQQRGARDLLGGAPPLALSVFRTTRVEPGSGAAVTRAKDLLLKADAVFF